MVNNLLCEKAEKEAALAELHREILAGHDNPDTLRLQVHQMEKELSSIRTKLDDKQEKLSEADRKLDALREEMTAMKERTEVMYCATLLFLGYVDDATTFAEGHGGGGSSSDLKWGRDEDEDEHAWARRCMAKAARMMHPSSGKKKKR